MTEQGYSSTEQSPDQSPNQSPNQSTEAVLGNYEPMQLQGDDLEEYNNMQLPHDHPHVFAKAMLAQLERLPLMELDSEQELFAQHRVALSA